MIFMIRSQLQHMASDTVLSMNTTGGGYVGVCANWFQSREGPWEKRIYDSQLVGESVV